MTVRSASTIPRNLRAAATSVLGGHHVRLWVLVVLVVLAVGSGGYLAFGWSLSDALYMTIITLTTVGFREVRDLDDAGRAWTGLVAVAGVGVIYGTIGIVVEALLNEITSEQREAKRMADEIRRLRGHVVLCGFGRVGATVARELTRANQRVVVVDVEESSLDRAKAEGHLIIHGDATSDDVLRAAGVERAAVLIASIDSDANNVFVTLSGRALNPNLFILGRVNAEGSEAKILQAGADRAVSPYVMAGRRMVELALRPRVVEFLDSALSRRELDFTIEQVNVVPGGPLDGATVGDLRARGVFTLAIVSGSGDGDDPAADRTAAHPGDDQRVRAGETLVVSGSVEALRELAPSG